MNKDPQIVEHVRKIKEIIDYLDARIQDDGSPGSKVAELKGKMRYVRDTLLFIFDNDR